MDRFLQEGRPEDFDYDDDSTKISWSRALKGDLTRARKIEGGEGDKRIGIYRPFCKQWLNLSRRLNEVVSKVPLSWPEAESKTMAIMLVGAGTSRGFSALMIQNAPNFHTMDTGQCFPRYLYEPPEAGTLFAGRSVGLEKRDALTDEGLAHFQAAYPSEVITKDDLFYYVYGLLHSEEYRNRYADNLSKQLPRIPAVKKAVDFWALVEAGRKLGDLHCDYETADPYPVTFVRGDTSLAAPSDPEAFYRVEQMKFAGKRPNLDKTTVIYNANITISDIPLEAYDYVVNGKPAIEWVIERQCVKTDKASGIVNDANRYAIETVGDPAYPLKLLQRVITVSLETMKVVRALPPLGDLS